MAEKSALIVDDSATARIMLARVLSSMDVAVKHATSGEDALLQLKSERPDLIFLDHLMPGMDGFQTLKALKGNPVTRDIPVIMYTSQNALRYQEEAKALGAAGVVTKQVDREQLYLLVERIWMQHEIAATMSVTTPLREEPALVSAGERKVIELRPGDTRLATVQARGDNRPRLSLAFGWYRPNRRIPYPTPGRSLRYHLPVAGASASRYYWC